MKSQIIIPSRTLVDVPFGGDYFKAKDINQFAPLEFLIGYFWQLPYNERRGMAKGFLEDVGNESYEPMLPGVLDLVLDHKVDYVKSLENGMQKRAASGTRLKAAKLLKSRVDSISSPRSIEFTTDPALDAANLKIYFGFISASVRSIAHANIRGPSKYVFIDRHTIDSFADGETVYYDDMDIQFALAQIKTQRGADQSLLTRNISAVLSRYADAKDMPGILPFNPMATSHIIMEALTLYYLGKGKESTQYSIDRNLLELEGFLHENLIARIANDSARVLVQRHSLAEAKEFGEEDRALKDAYVRYLKKNNYLWLGYVTEFPDTGHETIAEKWLSPKGARPMELSLVFGEDIPPLVIRRFPKQGDLFDFYGQVPRMKTTLQKQEMISGDQVFYRGNLLDPSSRRYMDTHISIPKGDNLELRMDISGSMAYRVNRFINS
jgi:hypothetical protein